MKEESTRQQKVSRLIQKEIASLFQAENPLPSYMVTVTKVRVTPDLGIARLYLSIFPSNGDKQIEHVRAMTNSIRLKLGQKVKNHLRIVPMLEFYVDDSLDYYDKINELLKQ